MLQSIEVPEAFKHEPRPYRAGVVTGRTDALEDMSKFAQGLMDRALQLKAAGKVEDARLFAAAGGALAEFAKDYIDRMRTGKA
jgi:hypothetical protein